jgi:5-hydroxyisourate hydrolase
MSAITTHVLDTVLGKPGAGIRVKLDRDVDGQWVTVGECLTDPGGRCRELAENPEQGKYRLTFATGEYFASLGRSTIYPEIVIVVHIDAGAHYHLPLLLSDNSYTTYRGS